MRRTEREDEVKEPGKARLQFCAFMRPHNWEKARG